MSRRKTATLNTQRPEILLGEYLASVEPEKQMAILDEISDVKLGITKARADDAIEYVLLLHGLSTHRMNAGRR